MSSEHRGGGVMGAVREVAPALSGNPASVWHAARYGTEQLTSALPDTMGLDRVKEFVRRHPVLSTCAVLAVAFYLGGTFSRARRW